MVMLEGKTMKEISMFTSSKLAPLESVVSTVTHFVLKNIKIMELFLKQRKWMRDGAVTHNERFLSKRVVKSGTIRNPKVFDIVSEMPDAISLGVGN